VVFAHLHSDYDIFASRERDDDDGEDDDDGDDGDDGDDDGFGKVPVKGFRV
jgi:hypothetical protein